MKYRASTHLKRADTTGRVPASILDGFVREELLQQIGMALKPQLTVQQRPSMCPLPGAADQVDFTTELVILSMEQWHQLRLQIDQHCLDLPTDKRHQLLALLDAIASPEAVGTAV